MAIIEQDSRTGTADRVYQEMVRRGCDPHAVRHLLPNLVSSRPEVSQRAADWLMRNALIGEDLSDEGRAQARQVVRAAQRYHQDSLESGEFTGEPAFKTQGRYGASEADLDAALEERAHQVAYPTMNQNRTTLALTDLEAQAQARHRRADLTLHEDGTLTDPMGNVVEKIDVPTFGPAPLSMRDTASSIRGSNGDGTTYYKNTSDEDAEAYWARNGGAPFGG